MVTKCMSGTQSRDALSGTLKGDTFAFNNLTFAAQLAGTEMVGHGGFAGKAHVSPTFAAGIQQTHTAHM
jgi:hypothetical protein